MADGIWVRQSEWVWTNSIAVRGEDRLILVDPGIDGLELNQLADDVDRLGIRWSPGSPPIPTGTTCSGIPGSATCRATPPPPAPKLPVKPRAAAGGGGGERVRHPSRPSRARHPLPADDGPVPGEIIEHQAHAVGHAAVLLADRGVLLAGDMLSDVLILMFDPRQDDQVGAYEAALDRLGEAAGHVDVVVPGHGAVAEGPEVAARLAADRAYIDALRRGEEPVDARLEQDWLSGIHESNLEAASRAVGHPKVGRQAAPGDHL